MKRILSVLMVISILLSLCACGSSKETGNVQTTSPASAEELSEEKAPASSSQTPKEDNESTSGGADEPTEITIETISPNDGGDKKEEVYWASKDKDPSDVWYHKADCEKIKDKEPEVLAWEIIEAIGMTPCEICKP